jgi:uncharacterized protein
MKANKRILLTGGTGFVGSRLTGHLVARGYEVTIASRSPDDHAKGRGARTGVRFVPYLPDLARFQGVVHLAGEPIFGQRWNDEVKQRIRASRVEGTRQLVEALAKASPRPGVLVSSSAIGYYGDRGDELLTEASRPGDDFLARVCQEWEAEALKAQELGVRTVCMRTGVVLGKLGGALKQMLPFFKWGVGGPIGLGGQKMSWIHIRDIADMYVHAIETDGLQGPLNGVAPGVVTNRQFSTALGRALHRPALLPVPPFALRLRFGEVAGLLTASQRVSCEKAQAAGYQFHYPDVDSALREAMRWGHSGIGAS